MKTLRNAFYILTLVVFLVGCTKNEMSKKDIIVDSGDKGWNCTVTQDQPSYIQLIDPYSHAGWFTGPCYPTDFNFGLGSREPVIYSNKDSMNVIVKIHVGQVFMRTRFYDDKIDKLFCQYLFQPSPPIVYPQYFSVNYGPGDYTMTVNTKLTKRGFDNYNIYFDYQAGFLPSGVVPDTIHYNYDIHEFGIRSAKTNQYAYSRFILASPKP